MKQVTAAVIEKDGKFLLAQRKEGDALAGKWEFPGGKIEEGETPEDCLKRELHEEFGVETRIGGFICKSEFEYNHFHVELLAYRARHLSGEFKPADHSAIAWVKLEDLLKYDLASADVPVVKELRARAARGAAARAKDPLHGVTLEMIVTHIQKKYGWEKMARLIPVRCFSYNPSIKSSLTFLRKTQWARKKVEEWYIHDLRARK